MRGKVDTEHLRIVRPGITPAYAGKSFHLQISGISLRGSPPPMRGKARIASRSAVSVRITPAYAGKS